MNIFGDLHLVDSAPVLGVLGLGVARVDDLLVVVEQLLADWTLGVQVLNVWGWKSWIFRIFLFVLFFLPLLLLCLTFASSFSFYSPGRSPLQGCPSPALLQSEEKQFIQLVFLGHKVFNESISKKSPI